MQNIKIPLIIIILLLFTKISSAQQMTNIKFNDVYSYTELKDTQPIIGKAYYKLSYVPDTLKKDSIVTERLELDFGKTKSIFSSYDRVVRDSMIQKNMNERMRNISSDNINASKLSAPVVFNNFSHITFEKYFTNLEISPEVITIQNIYSTLFLIKDTSANITWEIKDSTKNIQGNLCQKAVGESHGRIYTAWFCSDLPYSFGPRKLNGLPGLILEAYDQHNEVVYTLDGLEMNIANETIGLPQKSIDANWQEFNKAKAASEKNPDAFVVNKPMPSNNNSKSFKIVVGKPPKGFKKPVNNNPIDLK